MAITFDSSPATPLPELVFQRASVSSLRSMFRLTTEDASDSELQDALDYANSVVMFHIPELTTSSLPSGDTTRLSAIDKLLQKAELLYAFGTWVSTSPVYDTLIHSPDRNILGVLGINRGADTPNRQDLMNDLYKLGRDEIERAIVLIKSIKPKPWTTKRQRQTAAYWSEA